MMEFSSIEEATRALKSTDGQIYESFRFSSAATTHYRTTLETLERLAEQCGALDERDHGMSALGGLIGLGKAVTNAVIGNWAGAAGGAASFGNSVRQGQRLERAQGNAEKRLRDAIRSNKQLYQDLSLIANFNEAAEIHAKRITSTKPHQPGFEYRIGSTGSDSGHRVMKYHSENPDGYPEVCTYGWRDELARRPAGKRPEHAQFGAYESEMFFGY